MPRSLVIANLIKVRNNKTESLHTLWCVAHRSDLAFNDLSNEVPEISKVLSILSKISSFFHTSSIRTTQLKEIAEANNLQILSMPKLFQIRWAEYTYRLIRAILISWNSIILQFEKHPNDQSKGFLKFLKNYNNLKTVTFLGDLLFLFKRLQKKLQSDSLTVIQMVTHVKATISSLEDLKVNKIPSGYESTLDNSLKTTDDKIFLKDIELNTDVEFASRRPNRFCLEDHRGIICDSLILFLKNRLEVDSDFMKILQSFVKFDRSTNPEKVHDIIGCDLDRSVVYVQFSELSESEDIKGLSLQELISFLSSPEQMIHFREINIMLSRILACTPHSADVERCVSSNNLLKTSLRSSFKLDTENKYLYAHFNLPNLESWDPRPAVTSWILEKDRRECNVSTTCGKAVNQSYFRGIFNAAANKNGDEDESDAPKFSF